MSEAVTYYRACIVCGKVKRKATPSPHCYEHGMKARFDELRRQGLIAGSRRCLCGQRKASYREKCTTCLPIADRRAHRAERSPMSLSKILDTQSLMQCLSPEERAERQRMADACYRDMAAAIAARRIGVEFA